LVDTGKVVKGEDFELPQDLYRDNVLGQGLGHQNIDCLDDQVQLILIVVAFKCLHGLGVDCFDELLALSCEIKWELI